MDHPAEFQTQRRAHWLEPPAADDRSITPLHRVRSKKHEKHESSTLLLRETSPGSVPNQRPAYDDEGDEPSTLLLNGLDSTLDAIARSPGKAPKGSSWRKILRWMRQKAQRGPKSKRKLGLGAKSKKAPPPAPLSFGGHNSGRAPEIRLRNADDGPSFVSILLSTNSWTFGLVERGPRSHLTSVAACIYCC